MKQFLVTAFWLASMAIVTPANARPPVEFSFRQGYSSNLFQDPNRLSGAFSEATLSLRGSLDLDGSALSYELSQTERVVKTYIFGNSHETALKLGYQRQLLESVALKLEAAVTRSATGDVFLVLPQQVIGYRETDYGVQGGGEMRAAMLGGTTSVSGKYGRVYKGRAHFNIDLLLPSRLEADVGQMVLAANHVRPLFGGEAGAYAEYAQTFVPQDEQQRFIRYPARSLRGSLAFGRSIGSSFTFLADAGAQALFSDRLGTGKVPVEPYLRVQAEWKSDKGLTLAAGYRQNVVIDDLDDAVAEWVRTHSVAVSAPLTETVKATVGYELAKNDYYYYLYDTRTQRWTGKLAFTPAKGPGFALEYAHIRRDEADRSLNFQGHEVALRFFGQF
ncbi:MAG: hypothetical protein BGN83_16935 [Rhizobium sp. 63-7]|nr:MAG: hypothetical protein BGN83_16935 [Rhizobium sp. 63-7]